MAATRLEAFLSKYDRNWDKYSPELRDETLRKYSDPLALEQYLFETAPDFYQIEQSSPGYTRQLAGSLTGGESVGAQILAAPKQATTATSSVRATAATKNRPSFSRTPCSVSAASIPATS